MIKLENVCKHFEGKTVLNNLDIEVKSGEIYGLLGANGAGKSTTLNLILGFLEPDNGVINMANIEDGSEVNRDKIGYIPENVNLYPYLSGIENLDYFSRIAGLKFTNTQLNSFLLECGLNREDFQKSISEYSKGMRQKVGIAIAFAKKAKVLLLDEPASGLDPLASTELSTTLKNLSDKGTAVLMASHDIFRVRETCDRIGILRNGSLIDQMDTANVTTNELEKIYIEYMRN